MSRFGPNTTRQATDHPHIRIPNKIGKSSAFGHGTLIEDVLSEMDDSHLIFEARLDSPYVHSLAGEYDIGMDSEKLLNTSVSGICPICNNSRRRYIEKMYLKGMSIGAIGSASGASLAEVKTHFRLHFAGIHSAVAVAVSGITDVQVSELKNDFAKYQKGPAETGEQSEITQMPDNPGLAAVPRMQYAMDGGVQISPLRPWTKARARHELEVKLAEAINFYDEMLECRNKSRKVYDEIMENGELKYYSIAIAAIREQRGVVETLGKMSLIAKSLSDGQPIKGKNLSPELRELMQKLGVNMDAATDEVSLEKLPQKTQDMLLEADLSLGSGLGRQDD